MGSAGQVERRQLGSTEGRVGFQTRRREGSGRPRLEVLGPGRGPALLRRLPPLALAPGALRGALRHHPGRHEVGAAHAAERADAAEDGVDGEARLRMRLPLRVRCGGAPGVPALDDGAVAGDDAEVRYHGPVGVARLLQRQPLRRWRRDGWLARRRRAAVSGQVPGHHDPLYVLGRAPEVRASVELARQRREARCDNQLGQRRLHDDGGHDAEALSAPCPA
mmetsp:Transcript_2788/g.8314  ORF Transcript_2788/g.8314 Transcript_2788/m.8314 type:complete len:221 (+) Transcript_2788:704-1366(+)